MDPFAAGVTETGDREQVMVTLTGEILQVNATAALKLFSEFTVTVDVVEFPAAVVAAAGLMLKLKLFIVKL